MDVDTKGVDYSKLRVLMRVGSEKSEFFRKQEDS